MMIPALSEENDHKASGCWCDVWVKQFAAASSRMATANGVLMIRWHAETGNLVECLDDECERLVHGVIDWQNIAAALDAARLQERERCARAVENLWVAGYDYGKTYAHTIRALPPEEGKQNPQQEAYEDFHKGGA